MTNDKETWYRPCHDNEVRRRTSPYISRSKSVMSEVLIREDRRQGWEIFVSKPADMFDDCECYTWFTVPHFWVLLLVVEHSGAKSDVHLGLSSALPQIAYQGFEPSFGEGDNRADLGGVITPAVSHSNIKLLNNIFNPSFFHKARFSCCSGTEHLWAKHCAIHDSSTVGFPDSILRCGSYGFGK